MKYPYFAIPYSFLSNKDFNDKDKMVLWGIGLYCEENNPNTIPYDHIRKGLNGGRTKAIQHSLKKLKKKGIIKILNNSIDSITIYLDFHELWKGTPNGDYEHEHAYDECLND